MVLHFLKHFNVVFFRMNVTVTINGEVVVPGKDDKKQLSIRCNIVQPSSHHTYFETQVSQNCGVSILNNMFGYQVFTHDMLKETLHILGNIILKDTGMLDNVFHAPEGDFTIDVLKAAVASCKSIHTGWMKLQYLLATERNTAMVMPMDILYIHHHDDDNENDGHYFCYTCEHGFMWHKDSDEEKAHKLTKDEYEWLIDKFCKNEQWYSMLKLIHDESLDSDNEHATNKIFGMVYDAFQCVNVTLDFVTYTMHKHSFFITVDDSLSTLPSKQTSSISEPGKASPSTVTTNPRTSWLEIIQYSLSQGSPITKGLTDVTPLYDFMFLKELESMQNVDETKGVDNSLDGDDESVQLSDGSDLMGEPESSPSHPASDSSSAPGDEDVDEGDFFPPTCQMWFWQ